MEKQILSKNNSLILRGLAILLILFHNFLHLGRFGFALENENLFSHTGVDRFFALLGDGPILANCISFLGWLGVSVFVFLTGYGLAVQGFPERNKEKKAFIKRSFLKLFALLLPALLFYFALDYLHQDIWPQWLKRASYLTLLTNFAYPYLSCNPGVYWYFGLTFQFYLLWTIAGKYLNKKRLLFYSLVLLLGFALLCTFDAPNIRSIYRHCLTGWFFIFAIGVYLAKDKKEDILDRCPVWVAVLVAVASVPLMILLSKWMITWLFLPVIALAWFLALEKLLVNIRILSGVLRWVGTLSACIFVCHPIARTLTLGCYLSFLHGNLTIAILFYFSLTIAISIMYFQYYRWILSKLNP